MSCGESQKTMRSTLELEYVRTLAREAGFIESGLVALPYEYETLHSERFTKWIEAGHAGSMHYLQRRNEANELVRARIAAPFPWARSAIVCIASYNSAQPKSIDPAPKEAGWIARYGWSSRVDPDGKRRPSDYHKVLLKRLRQMEEKLHTDFGEFEARSYVDTGPIVERSVAIAAGLGWTGKNTCLIHPKFGSFTFLCLILTSLAVAPQHPHLTVPDRCGSCRRCIEACPTDALIEPHKMDATRCIAYLTIEHRDAIAPKLMEGMGRQIYGCDICQDVCPWNRKAVIGADPQLEPRPELVNPTLEALAALDEAQWEQMFNGSPVRRAGFFGLKRNIAIAMGNSGEQRFAQQLRAWIAAADEGLRSAAEWALKKLGQPESGRN